MDRRQFIGASAGAGMLAASGITMNSQAQTKNPKRPNVLWIMMDDARADTVGCYGKPWVKTPAMDKIAENGVRFETAIVQNPVCVPSRSSILTGHYAHTIKMMAMGKPAGDPPQYYKDSDGDRPNLLDFWKNAGITPLNVGKRHGYDRYFADKGDTYPHFDVYGKPRTDFAKSKMAEMLEKNPSGKVTIEIYSILGQRVAKVIDDNLPPGHHQAVFNAENLSSGIYIYRIEAKEFNQTKSMMLLK